MDVPVLCRKEPAPGTTSWYLKRNNWLEKSVVVVIELIERCRRGHSHVQPNALFFQMKV